MPESCDQSLKALTVSVVRAINRVNETLKLEHGPKRDKKIRQLLTELDVCNDEAMRVGLNFTPQYIARLKTGRAPRSTPTPQPPDQQRGKDHGELMKFHFDHIRGPIADGAAQGAAIKWLLDNFSVDALKQEYEAQINEQWRDRVSWISVKRDIGKRKHGTNQPQPHQTAAERRNAATLRNIERARELRSGSDGSVEPLLRRQSG